MKNRLTILGLFAAALPFAMAMNHAPVAVAPTAPAEVVINDNELTPFWPYEDPSVIGGCLETTWNES